MEGAKIRAIATALLKNVDSQQAFSSFHMGNGETSVLIENALHLQLALDRAMDLSSA